MKQGPLKTITTSIMAMLVFLTLTHISQLWGQPPVDFPQLQRLMALPPETQRQQVEQQRILSWLLQQAEAYRVSVNNTVIARSNLFSLGFQCWPPSAPLRRLVSPPLGTGVYYLTFLDPAVRANPATLMAGGNSRTT